MVNRIEIKKDGLLSIGYGDKEIELPFSLICHAAEYIQEMYSAKNNITPPPPPPGPPCRTYRDSFFGIMTETKESKQKRHDYEMFVKGYRAGVKSCDCCQPKVPIPQGPVCRHRVGDY